MTDKERIEFLRDHARGATAAGGHYVESQYDDIADRLEQLTRPPDKSPLTPEREALIRQNDAADSDTDVARFPFVGMVRDLLSALDHERRARNLDAAVWQDLLTEKHEACVQAGVAMAATRLENSHPAWAETLRRIAHHLSQACGPAQLPPHHVTHARMKRLEAALWEIVRYFDDQSIHTGTEMCMHLAKIAREALEAT